MKTSYWTTTSIFALILTFAIGSTFAAQNNQDEDTSKARPRYVIKGGEVYDKKTNLTWQRCSVGQTWKDGVGCDGVIRTYAYEDTQENWGGKWRVPKESELLTLLDRKRGNYKDKAMIDEITFPGMDGTKLDYWTSKMLYVGQNWYLNFGRGYTTFAPYHSFEAAVRLVHKGR